MAIWAIWEWLLASSALDLGVGQFNKQAAAVKGALLGKLPQDAL